MAFIVRGKIRSVRLLTTVVGLAVVAALAAATVVAAIYVPQIAIWVPIITLGLAECDSAPPIPIPLTILASLSHPKEVC
ncbi:MAG TPA: hypothetical protein VMV76_00090 [Dehalococcoidia bacterium]|nr:hypothetical protein [Dehalococcoidales bacterium]HUX47566.1 hypothetical protein [Dehalococcoidia bacterium]